MDLLVKPRADIGDAIHRGLGQQRLGPAQEVQRFGEVERCGQATDEDEPCGNSWSIR